MTVKSIMDLNNKSEKADSITVLRLLKDQSVHMKTTIRQLRDLYNVTVDLLRQIDKLKG
jgi:hypothetical protein